MILVQMRADTQTWTLPKNKDKKKPPTLKLKVFKKKAATYSPTIVAVPSALIGLTSLFGMGRGEPYRYNHLKRLV